MNSRVNTAFQSIWYFTGCRDAVVGRSLKDGELLGLLGNDRGHLHA